MRIFKTLSLLVTMLLLIAACEEKRETTAEAEMAAQENVNYDEVTNRWGEAWRSNRFDSVRNQTADDAILLLNGREFPQDSLDPWLERTSTSIRDLEMNSLEKGGHGDIAWDSGTFSHSYANDTVNYNGTYTFIWERVGGSDWKVSLMHISGEMYAETSDVQEPQQ